jgi:hypothetical protein
MTAEFPPPDARLAGKVKVVQFSAQRDVLRVASDRHRNGIELQPDANGEISRLAKLGKLEYERERKPAARRLGLRVPALDHLVAAERDQFDDGKQGRALSLPEPEPWPESVNGAQLLDALAASIRRHVVMPDHAADTATLWVLHTYLLDCSGISPRLAITSPEKGCGKTTLLDVLSRLVMRPLPTASATASAIFRVVEMQQPTLLIDEADTFLSENEELRGILNSGHRQGGSVIRTVGEDFEPRAFSTYSACAIALIGKLPATLTDRSVPIDLRRRRPDEAIEAFRFDRTGSLDQLARQAARWAMDHADHVRGADPDMPAGVFNRAADNWRPLLASPMLQVATGQRALGGRSNLLRRPATMTNPSASPCLLISAPSLPSAAPTGCHPPNWSRRWSPSKGDRGRSGRAARRSPPTASPATGAVRNQTRHDPHRERDPERIHDRAIRGRLCALPARRRPLKRHTATTSTARAFPDCGQPPHAGACCGFESC